MTKTALVFQPGQALGSPKLAQRLFYAYFYFVILLLATYIGARALLPEGSMRNFPALSSSIFERGPDSTLSHILTTLLINLVFAMLIVACNTMRVGTFTLGYLPLYANTAIPGLFAGSNSFSGGISAYTWTGLKAFMLIGFLEFSAYIFICDASVRATIFHANRWRGESFKRLEPRQKFHPTTGETVCFILAAMLLGIASVNEWLIFSF